MRLIVRDHSEAASAYVAKYIIDRINHFQPTPAHPFVLGLPTGSSPLGVYNILVEQHKAGKVSPSEYNTKEPAPAPIGQMGSHPSVCD